MSVMSRSGVCPLDIEVPGLIGFFCPSLVVADLERFAYQPEMKSGWLLVTICLGSSVSLRGSSSSGGLKVLQVLGASGSWVVRFSMVRRCVGRQSSSTARSFNDNKACCFQYAA